jgi:integrase
MWPSGTQLHGPRGVHPVRRYLDACWAESTKRAYAADVRDFRAWGGQVPASAECLARYLAERATRLAPATLARRLAGIGAAHTVAGFRDPTKDPLLGMVLKGIRRRHGVAQRRALPLDPRRLRQVWSRSEGLRGKRDRALVLLGFAAAFRRSELVSLNVEDLGWSDRGLAVHLRKSKTDQEQASRIVAVPWAGHTPCPARSVQEWLSATGITQGALFRSIDGQERLGARLHPQSVNLILKGLARYELLPWKRVSGHSLRAGFVTAAVEAGAGLASIQRQTGHVSLDTLAKYVRGVDPFSGNANDRLEWGRRNS